MLKSLKAWSFLIRFFLVLLTVKDVIYGSGGHDDCGGGKLFGAFGGHDDDDGDDIHGAYHDGHYGQRELESGGW